MKKVIVFLAIFSSTWGYSQSKEEKIRLKNNSETSAYVALIKVIRISLNPEKTLAKLYFDEVLHLKGSRINQILAETDFPGFDFDPNEEWLIFGDSRDSVIYLPGKNLWCTILNRDQKGLRNWRYPNDINRIAYVESLFSENTPIRNGISMSYYPDGKVERKEKLRKGKLNGAAEYYYPDGKIYGKVNYKKGKLDGMAYWFNDRWEEPTERLRFKKGIKTDTSVTYREYKGIGYKPSNIIVYDKHGNQLQSKEYSQSFQNYYLAFEKFYDIKENIETSIDYHPNGKQAGLIKYKNGKVWGKSYTYDEEGNLTYEEEYGEDGKLIYQKDYKKQQ